jgi:hypothetical protein
LFQERHFSTSKYLTEPVTGNKPEGDGKKANPDDFIKAAPFSELGATKTVRMVVLVAVSILATVETYTYGLWIWNRWFKKEEVVDDEE